MRRFPFKSILAGIALGSAVYFFPFLPGIFFAVLITGFFFRLFFFRRRFHRSHFQHFNNVIPIDGRPVYSTPIAGSSDKSFPVE